jgi:hypothetical protein
VYHAQYIAAYLRGNVRKGWHICIIYFVQIDESPYLASIKGPCAANVQPFFLLTVPARRYPLKNHPPFPETITVYFIFLFEN